MLCSMLHLLTTNLVNSAFAKNNIAFHLKKYTEQSSEKVWLFYEESYHSFVNKLSFDILSEEDADASFISSP